MEKIFEHTLLYDFYGVLLTEHQQRIYEDVVYNDLSLGEIADEYGITRQGVHDLIKRCDKILETYENKLHLVERFTNAKNKLHEIERLSETAKEGADTGCRNAECADYDIKERLRLIQILATELVEEL